MSGICFGCGDNAAYAMVSDPYIDMGYWLCKPCMRKCYPSPEERLRQLEVNSRPKGVKDADVQEEARDRGGPPV